MTGIGRTRIHSKIVLCYDYVRSVNQVIPITGPSDFILSLRNSPHHFFIVSSHSFGLINHLTGNFHHQLSLSDCSCLLPTILSLLYKAPTSTLSLSTHTIAWTTFQVLRLSFSLSFYAFSTQSYLDLLTVAPFSPSSTLSFFHLFKIRFFIYDVCSYSSSQHGCAS